MALLLRIARLSAALLLFTLSGADAGVFRFPFESSPVANIRVPVWQSEFPAITSQENLTLYDYLDVYYYCYVQFGTPAQRIRMMLDTNSSQVWVLNHHLGAHLFYNHNKSTTYQPIGTPVDHDGSSGFVSQDQITIGEKLSLPHHRFVEAVTTIYGPFFSALIFDGSIGLGLAPSPITNAPSLVPSLAQQGLLDQSVVGLLHGKSVNGHVTIGGIDSSAYEGDLHYTPVTSSSTTSWNLPLDAVLLDGKPLTVDKAAIVASSSPIIVGPKAEIDKIAAAAGVEDHFINCTSPGPEISFVFNGKPFMLTKDQYFLFNHGICMFGFAPNPDPNDQTWLVGVPFLRQFYTVLDYGKETEAPRVGFARAFTRLAEA